MERPEVPPLGAVVMGAIQDRAQVELAKAAALAAVVQKLDQVLDELQLIRAELKEQNARERRR